MLREICSSKDNLLKIVMPSNLTDLLVLVNVKRNMLVERQFIKDSYAK